MLNHVGSSQLEGTCTLSVSVVQHTSFLGSALSLAMLVMGNAIQLTGREAKDYRYSAVFGIETG